MAALRAAAVLALLAAWQPREAAARISGGRFKIDRGIQSASADEAGQVVYLGAFGYGENGRCQVRVTKNVKELRFPEGGCSDEDQNENTTHHTGFFLLEVDNVNRARTIPLNTEEYNLCTAVTLRCRDVVLMHQCDKRANPDTDTEPPCAEGEWRGVRELPAPGFYALFFFNCRRHDVDLEVRVSEYNLVDGHRDYLQVGDRPLPVFFLLMFFVYLGLGTLWGWTMKSNKQHVHSIHYLMAVLLVLKAGTMLFESLKYFTFQHIGTGLPVWDVFFYIFMMLKGIVLFTAILLIGTGWSFIRPVLQDKDRKILLVVLPLQVIVNIASIVIDETTEGDPSWATWQEALRVFDIVCCVIVLLPIVWSIKMLKDAQSTDGKVARNLARIRQFRTFYILVVAYIYFTRIIVVLIESALHYKWTWLGPFAAELGTLTFYIFAGHRFRPMQENPYLSLEAEDYAEGGHALDQEMQDRAQDLRDLENGNQPYDVQGGTAGAITAHAEARGAAAAGKQSTVKAVRVREDVDI